MRTKTEPLCARGVAAWAALCAGAGAALRAAGDILGAGAAAGGDAAAQDVLFGFMPQELFWGILALPIATALVSVIAYHPVRRRAMGVKKEEWETPKALILIAVAGVIVGGLVSIQPNMAFALFGFGSFIRFRTQVKNPKETVIIFLAAGIGCLCGLEQFTLAVGGTLFVFILLYALDRAAVGELERVTLLLKGLNGEVQKAANLYKEKLQAARVQVVSSKVSLRKGNVTFLLDKPTGLSTDSLEELLFEEGGALTPRSVEWIRE